MHRSRRNIVRKRYLPVWAVKSLAPWLIGGGLLVSFTASAGPRLDEQAHLRRGSTLNLDTIALPAPMQLGSAPTTRFSGVLEAPLSDVVDWLVQPAAAAPPGARVRDGSQAIVFLDHPRFLPATRMLEGAGDDANLTTAGRFIPQGGDTSTGALLEHDGGSSPSILAMLTAGTPDGATPALSPTSVAVTPGSTGVRLAATPFRVITVAALKTDGPLTATPGARALNPGYADLIEPENMNREQRCLAEAVYFEARSEPPEGQAAVAQVVLNRVQSGLYPESVCGVVYQNRHRYMGCQFSFACEGKSLRITEPGPWKQAVRIAREVTFGQTYLPKVGNATHYHADYVRPHWARVFRKNDTIGRHIFYRPKPGQS